MEFPLSSRRSFIAKTSMALAGTALLSSTASFASVFSKKVPFEGYDPLMGYKNDLRTFLSGKTLEITGTLFTNENNQLLPCNEATVEVWHLSPNSKEFYHRGKFKTNDKGEYTFWTDMPHRKEGQKARIFFKATSQGKSLFTELVLDNHFAYISHSHWEYNHFLGKHLFPSLKTSSPQTGEVTFNFIIN